jgi:UDP-N-acetylglucosamine--N-acetylmuramyl-(pentapeptide) pyrophosphoryl-undecaprenol N-acetylglucosamine transferase
MSKKNQKILITGGGTGGHVLPLMSIADELIKQNAHLLYIGSGNEIEKEEAAKRSIQYKKILTGKYRRYFDLMNVVDFFKFIIGFFQSFFIILFFWPDKVFSKGGFVGLPVVNAAWVLGRPIYIHETDAVLGIANKLALNKCKKIFVSFAVKYYDQLPADKVVYSGNPLNSKYQKIIKGKLFFNNKKTILITGGSQGARFINQTVAAIMERLTKKYNIIHLSGKLDYPWLVKNKWDHYKLYDFSADFPKFLYNCDLVISRSGGTIFEIAYCKKPAILIPLASAANDHQEKNAKILEKENAAVVLREKGLTSDSLYDIINNLLDDKKLLSDLSYKIASFSSPEAAKIIVKKILS